MSNKWSDYTIREKIALFLGGIVLCIQIFRYATNTLSESTSVEVFVFAAACLLLFAPKTIVSIIKKKKGVEDAD